MYPLSLSLDSITSSIYIQTKGVPDETAKDFTFYRHTHTHTHTHTRTGLYIHVYMSNPTFNPQLAGHYRALVVNEKN